MNKRKRRAAAVLALVAAALTLILAGCGSYTSGESFRDTQDEGYQSQETPEAAVQKWFKSMEWRFNEEAGVRDPELGRDFQAYFEVSSPALFPEGLTPDEEDWAALEEQWNSDAWEIEFLDLQLETQPPEAEEPGYDGNEAKVKIVGGQVRYIGKEMFGTTEYKVDDFQDKQGEIYLERIKRNVGDEEKSVWVIVGAKMLSEDEDWKVPIEE